MLFTNIAQATELLRSRICKLRDSKESSTLDENGWLERQLLLVDLWIAVAGVDARKGQYSTRYCIEENVAFSHAFLQILEALNKNAELRKSMVHSQ